MRFIQFPPVLHLQLKRFDFDLQSMRNYKIHSHYEFPRELDLAKYVDANSPYKGDPATYVLQGVMVHSGTAGGGHYYAYFRPTSKPRWYKFNDMKVTKATSEEAIEGNYGSDKSGAAPPKTGFFSSPFGQSNPLSSGSGLGLSGRENYTSAYMLQYVRKDHFEAVVAGVPKDAIPQHINQRFDEEERERERRKLEKRDAHLYTQIKVFDDDDLAAHDSYDLIDFANVRVERSLRMLKTTTALELKQQLLPLYRVDDPAKLRLRFFTKRRNQTIRASKLVAEDATPLLQQVGAEHEAEGLKILVEVTPRSVAPYFDPPNALSLQVFIKFYDHAAKRLRFVGRFDMLKSDAPLAIEPRLRAKVGLDAHTPLLYWEEIRWDQPRIDPIKQSDTLQALEIGNGDILVVQVHPGDAAMAALDDKLNRSQLTESGHYVNPQDMNLPLARQHYQFLLESITVKFKNVRFYEKDPGRSLRGIKSMTYGQVQSLLASDLGREVRVISLWRRWGVSWGLIFFFLDLRRPRED